MADRIAIRALCAGIQSAEGSPSAPTLLLNRIPTVGPVTLQINDMETGEVGDEQDGGLGATRQEPSAGRWAQFDVTMTLKGSGGDYAIGTNTPAADPLWRGAGCSKLSGSVSSNATIGYTTLDGGTFEYFTAILYSGSTKYTLTDCIALPKLSLEAGKRGTVTFTVIGLMPSDPVDAAIGTQSADLVTPPIWRGAASTMGAVSGLRWKKLAIDLGTAHTMPAHAGATDAIAAPCVTNRQAKADLTIEKVALTTLNPYTLGRQSWPGGTSTALTTVLSGGSWNTVTIATGQFAFRPPQNTDNGGIIDWPLSGRVLKSLSGTVVGITPTGREFCIVYS